MKEIHVYVDGACTNNGKPNAKAGYGVFFSNDDPRNESNQIVGKQSNNTAELTAFIRAMEILSKEIEAKQIINVYIDSEYVIKCASSYGSKLAKNEWKTSTNKIPPNVELVKKAHMLFYGKQNIKLHHIAAHTNKTDTHSLGNAGADRLACIAIGVDPDEQNMNKNIRDEKIIKLDWITFDMKDKAKLYGAKWDAKKKYWYADESVSPEDLACINALKTSTTNLPNLTQVPKKEDSKRTYIKIPFSKKDKAKSLGARWDSMVKSWYYVDSFLTENQRMELQRL